MIADGLPERIQALGQDALVAQKDGMNLHTPALLDSVIVTSWSESG
jgi:hypothetical protein